jgi:hypothetical protein
MVCNIFQFAWKEFENSNQISFSTPDLLYLAQTCMDLGLRNICRHVGHATMCRDFTRGNRLLIMTQEFSVQWSRKQWELKSNYKVYAHIVKHNYVLGGILFTICKAQTHVSAINVGHLHVVQWKLINHIYMHL